MARKLSTPKIKALTSIRDHGHAGPAHSNTVTALDNAKLFYIEPNPHGGFDRLVLTKTGHEALAAAQTVAPPVAPANPLAEKTPVELDTRAAYLDGQYGKLDGMRTAIVDRLQWRADQRPLKSTRSGRKTWALSAEDAAAELRRQLDAGEVKSWDVPAAREILSRLSGVDAGLDANRAEAATIEAEYARRPWSRFVGVEGGHIHSGIWCAGGTIRPTTVRTWAPLLSGLSVADAVAKLGPTLCTHCFPSAPVEWTQGAAKADDSCEGSGQAEVPGTYVSRAAPIGKCRGCDRLQSMTPRGVIRKHKPAPCAGSGQDVVVDTFWRGEGECGGCHTRQVVTSRGTITVHAAPK